MNIFKVGLNYFILGFLISYFIPETLFFIFYLLSIIFKAINQAFCFILALEKTEQDTLTISNG